MSEPSKPIPDYAKDGHPSNKADTSDPPSYESLHASLRDDMSSLAIGNPHESISVPMISRVHQKTGWDLNPFSRKTGKVTQTVTVRKMTREFYLKHYAKDAEGNFVGTAGEAPDAALVFVPSKSAPQDIMRQVQEVAFKKQQLRGMRIGPHGEAQKGGGSDAAQMFFH